MSRRLYRLVLRCYPAGFRRRFGQDMEETFSRDLAHASRRGALVVIGLWARTLAQTVLLGTGERWSAAFVAREATSGTAGTGSAIGEVLQDVRFAARTFARNPSFAIVVVVTMALGIGASTSIFSVVNGVLLRPLPYGEPDRLVVVGGLREGPRAFPSGRIFPDIFADWQEGSVAFDGMAAVSEWTLDLVGEGDPERLNAAGVSVDFLPLLGVTPLMGRNFSAVEDQPDAGPVVIVSHGLWRRHWGADPDILGRRITLSGTSYTVVGVLASDFRYPEVFDLPAVDVLYPYQLNVPTQDLIYALARLRDGVTRAEARDALAAIESPPAERRGIGPELIPLASLTIGDVGPRLTLLLGAVGLLLLTASANVANLLLARATSRTREIAVRTSLGAGRLRITRQLLTESLLLSAAGGAMGVAMAAGVVEALAAIGPADVPRLIEVSLDGTVLAFTLVTTLATGVLFGIVPAAQLGGLGRSWVGSSLGAGGSPAAPTRVGKRIRSSLVVSQVALALVLLVGASLLIESFVILQNVDPGFDATDVSFASVILDERYPTSEEQRIFFTSVLEQASQSVPGVVSTAVVTALPMSGDRWRAPIVVEGYTAPEGARLGMDFAQVSEEYFSTIGTRVVAGRVFDEQDRGSDGPRSLVVNEAFARQFWPDGNAVGRRLKIAGSPDANVPWLTVIGVVEDVRQQNLAEPAEAQTYLFYRQMPSDQMRVIVRSAADFSLVSQELRRAIWAVDPNVPVVVVRLQDHVAGTIAAPRFYTGLLTGFATLALMLAAVGIYGTMSYVVGERQREMGIRLALGAAASSVTALVVRQGLTLCALGVAIGVVSALAGSRLLESSLFGVTAADPSAFLVGVTVLCTVALVASYLPARLATRVDAARALRAE